MNWWMRVLQTLALPLGHVTIFGATVAAPFGAADEARTRYLHLGKVALYQMSYGRTFHVFVPDCLPATLIIIPYRPEIVNHKFAFSAKKLETRLSVFKRLHFCGLYLCHHSSLP